MGFGAVGGSERLHCHFELSRRLCQAGSGDSQMRAGYIHVRRRQSLQSVIEILDDLTPQPIGALGGLAYFLD